MSTASVLPSPRDLWQRAWALSPALTLSSVVMLVGAVVSSAGILLDPRLLLGDPLWLKPAKFYVSLAAYDATILYFFSFLPAERRRLMRVTGAILSGTLALEMVAITLQAARGVRSHFNIGTRFDELVFHSMGVAITVLWVTMVVLAVVLLRTRLADRPFASALRMGLVVGLLGSGLGYFMTAPRAEQLTHLKAGEKVPEMGSHTFGAKDGGPGLPVVGWSTTAGDLRPAHFLGLHGMQLLPVLALLLARRRVSEVQRLATVRAAGVAYAGLVTVLAIQALRELPIIQWDATGVATLAVAALASLATYAATLAFNRGPSLVGAA